MVGFKGLNLGDLGQKISSVQTPNLLSSTMGAKGADVLKLASGLGIGGTSGGDISGLLGGLTTGTGQFDATTLLNGGFGQWSPGGGSNPFGSVMGGLGGGSPNGAKAGALGSQDMWLPNPLSAVDQPAYHIGFYIVGDKLGQQIAQTGDTSLLSGGGALLIAETGLTEFNITDLEINNMAAAGSPNRNYTATTMTIKITEPMGASLLDRLYAGAQQTGVINFHKAMYFLKVKFHGYDPSSGQYLDQIGGKTWVYCCKFSDVMMDVNEGGAKYSIVLTQAGDFPSFSHYSMINLSFAPSASTVGEFFQQLKTNLEQAQLPLYGYVRHTYNFVVHELPLEYDIMTNVTSHPSTWALQSPDFTLQHSRETSTQGVVGETETGVENQISIKDMVSKLFGSTLEGQQLIARSMVPEQPSNQAYNAVLWKVESEFKLSQSLIYDVIHDDYNYDITFHIIPYVTTSIMMSVEQREDSKNQTLVAEKIFKLQQQGRLRKQYQYLFTGLNTEVIDYDIQSNFFWFGWVPNTLQSQGDSSQSTPEMMGDQQFDNQTMPALKAKVDPLIQQIQQLTGGGNVGQIAELSGQIQSLLQQAFNSSGLGQPTAGVGGSASSNSYVEVLDPATGYGTPISYEKPAFAKDRAFMGQVENTITSAADVYAMAINQAFAVQPALQNLDLTIRGDPYWMGYTQLELGTAPGRGAIEAATAGYPDFHMMDNHIMVQFAFPQGVDDSTGEPILNPVNLFTGIYVVNAVVNKFSGGKFTQNLKGFRVPALPKEFSKPMTGPGGYVPSGLGMPQTPITPGTNPSPNFGKGANPSPPTAPSIGPRRNRGEL